MPLYPFPSISWSPRLPWPFPPVNSGSPMGDIDKALVLGPTGPLLEQCVQRPWGSGVGVLVRHSPRWAGSRTQPLSSAVLFHKGPYQAALHIPRRPSRSPWINLKQQRFERDARPALRAAWKDSRRGRGRPGQQPCPRKGGLRWFGSGNPSGCSGNAGH